MLRSIVLRDMAARTLCIVSIASITAVAVIMSAHADDDRAPVKVVATLAVLGELAREVGGDHVRVEVLADPHQDPHFVQPRPTLMKKVRDADLFIELGLQLELWGQKVVDGAGNPRVQTGQPGRVVAAAGIATLERPLSLSRANGDVHPQGNPHVWLDPLNAKRMARNIAAGLAGVAPQWRDEFMANAAALAARIDVALFGAELVHEVGGEKLSRLAETNSLAGYLTAHELNDKLGGWLASAAPLRGAKVVTYHKTWSYFAQRFGLIVPIEIEEKPGITPSAKHRDAVVDLIIREHVKAIVEATFYDRRAADYIREKTGVKILELAIGPSSEIGDGSYIAFMDYLVHAITAAVSD